MKHSLLVAVWLPFAGLAAQSTVGERPDAGHAAFRDEVDRLVAATQQRERVPGISLLIAFGDAVLIAKGYGLADLENEVPVQPETVFRIGSITKQFTAAAILKLVDDGKLRLDDKLNDLLPGFAFPGKDVTVHQLLNHTSGIKSYTDLAGKAREVRTRRVSHREIYELIKDEPFDFEPGTAFRYNNSAYYLLGVIIEKVSHKGYAAFLAKELWRESGMTATCYGSGPRIIKNRARGYSRRMFATMNAEHISMRPPFAAGALLSTARDLHRWNLALHGGRLLSPSSYAKMTTPTGREAPGEPPTYGYGIEILERDGHKVYLHGGRINGFRSILWYYPHAQLTIVLLFNTDHAGPWPLSEQIADAALASRR